MPGRWDFRLWRGPRCLRHSRACVHDRSGRSPALHDEKEWCRKGGNTDQIKGQVTEAVGRLTGNKDLESEGCADRRAGEAKQKLDHAKDKVEEVMDNIEGKIEEAIDKAKGAGRRK